MLDVARLFVGAGAGSEKADCRIIFDGRLGDLLLVLDEKDELVMRSARNIPGVTVLPVAGLNVYDVLKHQNLAMTKSAVERVNARLGA